MASDDEFSSEQLQKLEELFVVCKFPNKGQTQKWSKDLGIDADQVEFWFKNKVLLLEIEEKRQENDALRKENAKLQLENIMMCKKLENYPKCRKCSRNEGLEDLLRENAKLREEHQTVTNIGILQNSQISLQLEGQGGKKDVETELGSPTSTGEFDDQ